MPPSTPASLPAIPANLDKSAKVIPDTDPQTYGEVTQDHSALMSAYGSLAIDYNNLLLWGRCVVAKANGGAMPANCPK